MNRKLLDLYSTEEIRGIHNQLLQTAITNSNSPMDIYDEIEKTGQIIELPTPTQVTQRLTEPEQAEIRQERLKRMREEQMKKQPEPQTQTSTNQEKAEIRQKQSPQTSKPKSKIKSLIKSTTEKPKKNKIYRGLEGAYEFVKDRLAQAESVKKPDLMREARWRDNPQLSPIYYAIRNHIVDGIPFGSHNTWHDMIINKFNPSVAFKLALGRQYSE